MSSMNKCILAGNLGDDPTRNYTQAGRAVCNLRVATNESYTDSEGKKHKQTDWHRIVVWGDQAESCYKYLKKGRGVLVEGKVKYRKYTKDEVHNGVTIPVERTVSEVVARNVQFLAWPASKPADETPAEEPAVEDNNEVPKDEVPF